MAEDAFVYEKAECGMVVVAVAAVEIEMDDDAEESFQLYGSANVSASAFEMVVVSADASTS